MGTDAAMSSAEEGVADVDRKALEAAANWYATLRSDNVSAADQQAWQSWISESDAHARAWACIEAVSQRFGPLRAGGQEAALAGFKAARRRPMGRRQVLTGLAGILGLGVVGWMGWRHTSLPEVLMAWGADYRTATGEQRELTLTDGSRVWLNTGSALRVDFLPDARVLKLLAGEILAQTAADADLPPLYVDSRHGRMQALGTRFSVLYDDLRTRLDVFEGAVEIRNTAGDVQRVIAGLAATFTATDITIIGPAERAREAWHRGVLIADNIPLQALVEELARYQRGRIGVAPEVAEISVMGVYPANDTDRALAMLENALPIRIRRTLPWWVTVEAR
ncbi:iron dicitrate transport regulator FecR [Ectothiorhodospira shaposhnikovii]|uniref:FecR domain-containing protein n=1 Tax=Ectothiorhodospira shaposhnikovii TaxID=1054 RepID=UPI001906D5A6|nr:FecR domain-containing protein [Ectothiorhodospira shaposhnikovii]MBK1674569.1 iron dicitrate transport regulator FecR [Ectothiorhodospira shaposhnikovii]